MARTAYNMLSTYAIVKRKAEYTFVQSVLFALRFVFLFLFVSLGALGTISSFGLALGLVYELFCVNSKFNNFSAKICTYFY
ncbi:MAG: hypothetical protein PWP39_1608 [Pyrococcus sp.]|nr:hypothetical protein [Pyrococcus sp.]